MKKRLNLEELSLELPKIEINETRFLLGGDDYGNSGNPIEIPEVVVVGTSSGGNSNNESDPDQGEQDYEYSNPDYQDYQAGGSSNSQSETSWAIEHPIAACYALINKGKAEDATVNLPGQNNGFAYACRHAFWMALNAADFGGTLATELGVAHEQNSSSQAETNMDLTNNAWGIEFAETWGSSDFTFSDFMDYFWDAVQNGEIVIIDQGSIPSTKP